MRAAAGLVLAAWAASTAAMAAVPGPERSPTAPASIVSLANSRAGPVTIPDLFETRAAAGAALAPDAKTVVFSGNIFGRFNLWKVLEHEDPLLQQYERGLIGDPIKDKRFVTPPRR